MKQRKRVGTILYLTAFVLWLFIGLIKYTYFKDVLMVKDFANRFFCVALILLLAKTAMDFKFTWRNVIGLFLLMLFMTIACAHGSLQFATMFALIFCATGVPFRAILKTALVMHLIVFLSTITASQTGILEDYIWEASTRYRHGLGFTHCMLASHFGLFTSVIYIAIVKKMTWFRAVVILAANGIIFFLTDGRTDLYLSILFVVLALLFGNLGQRLKGEKILSGLAAVMPFVLCAVSIILTAKYTYESEMFLKLNLFLNNRLKLGNAALQQYGFPWFGYKIKWVGASVLHENPTLVYNYVDNSYMMMIFTYGTIFVFAYCLAMAWLLYKRMRAKDTMMIVCLVIILAFGMLNPQSMYLTYNPFLVLLAGFWNPAPDKNMTKKKG